MAVFDSKIFNPTVFEKYLQRVPNLKRNELIKSGAIQNVNKYKARMVDQVGGNYIIEPIKGLLDGDIINYDGETNITATSRKTYMQGKVAIGRAKAWVEKDFSQELTGVDWIKTVAGEVAEYYQGIDQDDLLAILAGIFSMSDDGAGSVAFKNNHIVDLTSAGTPTFGATTLNTAIQRAGGDNKAIYQLAFMHSVVATNLENLQLLDYLKYTDADGITRDLGIGTLNGRLVIIDDEVPTTEVVTTEPVYSLNIGTAATAGDKIVIGSKEYTFVANDASDTGDKIKVGAGGTAAQQATNIAAKLNAESAGLKDIFTIAAGTSSDNTKVLFTGKTGTNPPIITAAAEQGDEGTLVIEVATKTPAVSATNYTTYVLGKGAFEYENLGARVPSEMGRDPATNGGQDTLYTRQRKIYVPKWISFTKASMSTASPTKAELSNGANWEVVNSGEAIKANRSYVNHKGIPMLKIITRG